MIFFIQHELSCLPTSSSLKNQIIGIAKSELLLKHTFPIGILKEGFSEIGQYREMFGNVLTLDHLKLIYSETLPSCEKDHAKK